MIKMLVSSFYNTIINEEDAISYETMIEIDRIRSKAVFVMLTNRRYEEVLYYNEDYPFIDYIISLNGAIIYDVMNKKILFNKKISKNKINLIENIFSKNKKKYYTKDKILDEINDNDIYKIEVEITKKDLEKIDSLPIEKSIIEINNKKYLEITEETTYKALEKLMKHTKINKENIVSILGNENEKEILNNIDKSYITRRCSNNLKKCVVVKNKNKRQMKIEDILREI